MNSGKTRRAVIVALENDTLNTHGEAMQAFNM
jgi:hypothetical protein